MNFRGGTLRYNFADGDIDINFQKILNNYTVRTTKLRKIEVSIQVSIDSSKILTIAMTIAMTMIMTMTHVDIHARARIHTRTIHTRARAQIN